MSVNRVVLVGHLGAEPESREMADGSPVCNIRLATSERWKDKQTGEPKEQTEWHRVVLYRRLAEVAAQYLHKGAQVYVEGKLRHRKWTDNQGTERHITEIEATELQMLGKPQAHSPAPVALAAPVAPRPAPPAVAAPDARYFTPDDDIPF